MLKEFGGFERTSGVPGLDLPGLDILAIAAGYGVRAHRPRTTDELADLLRAGVADRSGPTLIDVPITRVDTSAWRAG